MRTRFAELVGCDHPVQLAALGGGVGGPELAAAVRDAAGLGLVSAGEPVPAGCGVNLLAPFVESPAVVAEAARRSGIVELFYGRPDATLVAAAQGAGAIVGWRVGSGDEAAAAVAAGCDDVVVQGVEAGGHVRGEHSLDVVLADARARMTAPVVAAGGISTPDRVAQLLAAGTDTVLTEWFDDGWPRARHRVLGGAPDAARRSGWRSPQPPSIDVTRSVADMAHGSGRANCRPISTHRTTPGSQTRSVEASTSAHQTSWRSGSSA